MLDCLTAGGKMKRLDLAINDKAGILDIQKLKEKYKAGECISYFRMQKDYSGTENEVAIYQRIQEKPYISVQPVVSYICVLIRRIMSSMSRMAQKLKIQKSRTVLKYA